MTAQVNRAGTRETSGGRWIAFRVIALLVGVSGAAFGLFTAVFGLIDESQRIHAFHNTVVSSLLLVLSAPPALIAARAPERATPMLVHLGALGVAGLVTMALALTIDPFTLPVIVLIGVLWLVRPPPERPMPPGRPSYILLLLVLAGAIPLAAYALTNAELQRIDTVSEHTQFYHWVETAFYAASIPLVGLLAALRPTAFRFSAWSAGIALSVLGAGSLLLGRYASALDASWPWAALVGGVVFVALGEWEARRSGSVRSS
jgi:hypothetical protein